jgi:hypothetical protein
MLKSVGSFRPPIRVRLVDAFGSGGSGWVNGFVWWASIEDCQGDWIHVCLDGRKASLTCHRLFEGAKHPSKPEAKLIELGSVEEGIIISLLSHWLDSSDVKHLRQEALEQMRFDLIYYGDETPASSGP